MSSELLSLSALEYFNLPEIAKDRLGASLVEPVRVATGAKWISNQLVVSFNDFEHPWCLSEDELWHFGTNAALRLYVQTVRTQTCSTKPPGYCQTKRVLLCEERASRLLHDPVYPRLTHPRLILRALKFAGALVHPILYAPPHVYDPDAALQYLRLQTGELLIQAISVDPRTDKLFRPHVIRVIDDSTGDPQYHFAQIDLTESGMRISVYGGSWLR